MQVRLAQDYFNERQTQWLAACKLKKYHQTVVLKYSIALPTDNAHTSVTLPHNNCTQSRLLYGNSLIRRRVPPPGRAMLMQ